MARLLLFNLMTDADDPILGFATRWIKAIAPYYDAIDIITMNAGRFDLPDHVHVYSVGKERGYGEARRTLEFYRLLITLLVRHRYEACFAHMMPLFAAMAGPLLTLRGIHTTLWYTQPRATLRLRLALALSYRAVSAVASSFPIPTDKLRPLGHGIDTHFFAPGSDTADDEAPLIVHVGRLTRIKNQHTLLRACADLDVRVTLVGGVPDGYDSDYRDELEALVDELDMRERVIFTGDQQADGVRSWLHRASVNVNLTKAGSFDKAVLEGMACGVPSIVCNPAFEALFRPYHAALQVASTEDVAGLRARITALLAMPEHERQHMSQHLREQVIAHHSLDTMARRLVNVLRTGELE